MCGINGFNFSSQALVEKMNKVTAHRGPDQTAVFCDQNISLGFNRLAIIDLSDRASQPMWNSDHTIAIIFNGEIYNYKDLRLELKSKYQFKSESDTEVILNAYQEYGIDCVKKFNGMFVFAVWDTRYGELFIARDQMGIKPLYYYWDNTKFIFSSEIKAILEHDIPRTVDQLAFSQYFSVFYVPEPRTMFAGISKLPAASWLCLKGTNLKIEKYWEVTDYNNLTSYSETKEKIRTIFDDSVKRQLVADRPVGVFLSGGIDSTAVLGATAAASDNQVKTFSIGFETDQDQKFNADFHLAADTAHYYGTKHHAYKLSASFFLENIEKIVWHLDEPNFNPTAMAQYLLSLEAKKTVTVALGGDGGDELFGGYPRYYYSRWLSHYQKLGLGARQMISRALVNLGKEDLKNKLSLGPNAHRVMAFLGIKNNLAAEVLNPNKYQNAATYDYFNSRFFNAANFGDDFEKSFMNLDRQSWLVDESLMRTDRMTMAAGLEERVPVLDIRLVELANKIPTAWKLNVWNQTPKNFQGKKIWKDALADYLPSHVLHQQKRGWFTPMAKWLRGDLKSFASEILNNLNPEYFNRAGVQAVWQDHLSGKRYNLNIIWAMIMWQLWYDRFIKK